MPFFAINESTYRNAGSHLNGLKIAALVRIDSRRTMKFSRLTTITSFVCMYKGSTIFSNSGGLYLINDEDLAWFRFKIDLLIKFKD